MDRLPGRNLVMEALKSGRKIEEICLSGTKGLEELILLAKKRGVPLRQVDREELDILMPEAPHQGVVALVESYSYASLEEIFDRAAARGEDPLILLLDSLQDPQNLGTLLRSADCGGVHGVIIPKKRAVGLTPGVVRASAGAVEYVPVVQVTNLVRTMVELKARGLWLAGAEADGQQLYYEADLTGPIGLVIGGEHRGLGRLVREHCDFILRLPLRGRLNSLNAAIAGSILIFEVLRQRAASGQK
ncbi:MAG: 23S rRNA (guanosine(2251)-2'-O)-methyltransferase RlmB [Firmicutes bacterium]|nr:23S rRNA (guanosine(2251)-2'-O)-methyltransferase RlmB [Bacillota bacterium]